METALITGASGGIGLELAKIFVSNKINLVLIARSEQKLNELAEVFTADGIKVIVYAKDLSNLANAEYIYNDLKSKNIAINYLVNNAGFGNSGNYTDIPWQKELEMLNLNIITLAYFTKLFAKDMKERGAGKILNVASTAAYQPGPNMAAYSATKAFVLSLTEAVNYELRKSGVTVSALCPGLTISGFQKAAGIENIPLMKLNTAGAAEVADYGYKLMMSGKRSGIHGFLNRILAFSVRFTPKSTILYVSAKLLGKK